MILKIATVTLLLIVTFICNCYVSFPAIMNLAREVDYTIVVLPSLYMSSEFLKDLLSVTTKQSLK